MNDPNGPIEAELVRAVNAASGNAFAMRAEKLGRRITLTVGWIADGLSYRHFEVVVATGEHINAGAILAALREVKSA